MESQVVRRRANIIAAHLTSHQDISATATHVFPMSCSNSPNSFIRRYDNRMHFARQGSSSQGCYMRQASNGQSCSNSPNSFIRRYDNRMHFARQGSASQGCYMRQASNEQGNYIQPSKSTSCENKGYNALEAPSFSRPAQDKPVIPTVNAVHSVVQGCSYTDPAPEAPVFARPVRENGRTVVHYEEKAHNLEPKSVEWSPRMDIVESGLSFVVTLEIPGVSVDNVKVEVHDQSLIINGNRSNWCCGSNNSAMSYHRREILRGPYRIVWPLPSTANKKNVSAEIQERKTHGVKLLVDPSPKFRGNF
ncbi:hypothetical protein ACS0TY_018538 [Phlomoides rotata]